MAEEEIVVFLTSVELAEFPVLDEETDGPSRSPEGYVYMMREEETKNFKIGKTQNLKKRLSDLQTGNSQTLKYVSIIIVSDMNETEAALHKAMEQKYQKVGGGQEWYTTSGYMKPVVNLFVKIAKQ